MFDFLFGLVLGYIIAFFYWRAKIIAIVDKVVLNEFDEDGKDPEKSILRVKVEQHGDQFLLFAEEDDRFVMQGTTMAELVERVKNLPEIEVKIVNGGSAAAKALLATGSLNENSNNQ